MPLDPEHSVVVLKIVVVIPMLELSRFKEPVARSGMSKRYIVFAGVHVFKAKGT